MKILDHGYVTFIEGWGSDRRIVEAARMSTDKGFLGWGETITCPDCKSMGVLDADDNLYRNYTFLREAQEVCSCKGTGIRYNPGDEKLLKYLYEHHHDTPFEMAGMVIEVQAPIMVFREWHRHRTQSYNEMSARYTPLPNTNYRPTPERCLVVNETNKQAGKLKGASELTHEAVLSWLTQLDYAYDVGEATYQLGLQVGIPKELARLPVAVGRYSRMRASANLRNWLSFLTLRMDEHAQFEIRQFANEVGRLIYEQFPRTWELFQLGR